MKADLQSPKDYPFHNIGSNSTGNGRCKPKTEQNNREKSKKQKRKQRKNERTGDQASKRLKRLT